METGLFCCFSLNFSCGNPENSTVYIKIGDYCSAATHVSFLFTGMDLGGSPSTPTMSTLAMPWPQPPAPMTVNSRACPVMLTPYPLRTVACKSHACWLYASVLFAYLTGWSLLIDSFKAWLECPQGTNTKLAMVSYICKPRTFDAEAGELSWVPCQPDL